jgi:hypothetical protein
MFRDPERIPKELQSTANPSSVWQLPGPWSCVAEGVPLRNTKELLPRGSRTKCNGRKSAALLDEFRKRTEPGWNLHQPSDVCIDSFEADRGPDQRYRTSPIGALSTHFKGGFYHDGRFADLNAVVNHYNTCMNLGLTDGEKSDLVQYLLSLKF